MSTVATSGELLSPAEVARRLGVHRASVYRWIHTGELPAVRLGHDGHSLRSTPRRSMAG